MERKDNDTHFADWEKSGSATHWTSVPKLCYHHALKFLLKLFLVLPGILPKWHSQTGLIFALEIIQKYDLTAFRYPGPEQVSLAGMERKSYELRGFPTEFGPYRRDYFMVCQAFLKSNFKQSSPHTKNIVLNLRPLLLRFFTQK